MASGEWRSPTGAPLTTRLLSGWRKAESEVSMYLRFEDRTSGMTVGISGVVFEVERMSWNIQGGPAKASVVVRGPRERVCQALHLLRYGVVISDLSGLCWWGYVHSVELVEAGMGLKTSMDDMVNRTAVRYRDERISPDVLQGWQFQTDWAEDSWSRVEWGTKEQIYTKVPASPAEAAALRAAVLAERGRPRMRAVGGRAGLMKGAGDTLASAPAMARLELRGWWDTLGWMYYGDTRGYVGYVGGGTSQNIGQASAEAKMAESFTVPVGWDALTMWFKVGKYQLPTDNLKGEIWSNVGAVPWGVVATSSVAAASLSGDLEWVRFEFSAGAYSLVAGTTYWAVLSRSGTLNSGKYYRATVDEGLGYSGGTGLMWNGSAWVARSPAADLVFQITGQAQTTDQIAAMVDPGGAGQFLKGVFVKDGSGVYGRQYRDGRETALKEVGQLLEQGASDGSKMVAWVGSDRILVVRKAPAYVEGGAELLLLASGELRAKGGGLLPASVRVVGKWAAVEGLEQLGGDKNAPGQVLIEMAEWSGGRMKVGW